MPEPMIKFDPAGSAPLLSYRLPDATSYPGRHYVRLELDPGVFKPEVEMDDATDGQVRGGRPGTVAARHGEPASAERFNLDPILAELLLPAGVGVRALPDGQLEFHSGSPVDPALASLRRDDLVALRDAGLRPAVVRSLTGRLTLMTPLAQPVPPAGDNDSPTSGGAGVPTRLSVGISSPSPDATVQGPRGGVDVVVTGSAAVVAGLGMITDVEARVDGGGWVQANPENSGDYSLWSVTLRIDTGGWHDITVRANGAANKTKTATQRINAVLINEPAADTTAPTITVTAPAAGSVLVSKTGSVQIHVAGSATDASGIQTVETAVDDGPWVAFGGDPAAWAADVTVSGAGAHQLRVRAMDGAGNVAHAQVPISIVQRQTRTLLRSYLMLVESYRLSSFLGRYGAGRVLKTFSLLPGERTKISIKSWQRTTETSTAASSIVDSVNSSSAKEFSSALQRENTDKQTSADEFKWKVEGELEQGWGTGRAKISAGASGGCNAARERFGKTVTGVTGKHLAEASSKRDVTVNAEYERTVEQGEETSIEREIQNINASRTINFVFRQMNQEFVSILHLVDVRVAYVRMYDVGLGEDRAEADYREIRLMELPSLLEQAVVPGERAEVEEQILEALHNLSDYQDTLHDVTETVIPKDQHGVAVPEAGYVRIRRNLEQTYQPDATDASTAIKVPGIIVAVTTNTLRTEGVIVDSLLGQGDGLDAYSQGLQDAAVEERVVANDRVRQETEAARQRDQIIADKDEDAAEVYRMLHPAEPTDFTLNINGSQDGHASVTGPIP